MSIALGVTPSLCWQAQAAEPRGPDFNDDGFQDLAIGVAQTIGTATGAGLVNVLFGSATGLAATGSFTSLWENRGSVEEVSEAGDEFGHDLAWGDFNGDCFDDLAVGVPGENLAAGSVHIFFGSSSGFALVTPNDVVITRATFGQTAGQDLFGEHLAPGDFNGDGFDDLAISARLENVSFGGSTMFEAGAVHIIYGGTGGLLAGNTPAAHTITRATANVEGDPNHGAWFANDVIGGDFNCDGKDDLAIGMQNLQKGTMNSAGAVSIIYGSSSGVSPTAGPGDEVLFQQDAFDGEFNNFGGNLAVGNFNGDIEQTSGLDHECMDLAVASYMALPVNSGAVGIFYGTPLSGIQTTSPVAQHIDQAFGGTGQTVDESDAFGFGMTQARADNDAIDDLVIGVSGDNDWNGTVQIYRGTTSGLSANNIKIWTQSLSSIPDTSESRDFFGGNVTYGRYKGLESMGAIAVSASGEDLGDLVPDAGQVDVMQMANTATPTIASALDWWQNELPGESIEAGDFFGTSLVAARNRGFCLQ